MEISNNSRTLFLALIALATIKIVNSCTPAEQALCKLPNCLCPSLNIPGGLTTAEIPQIVYLTFDNAVSTANYHFYEELIFPRKNPNGHSISATFFVSHEYTNYSMIHELWRKGHEIGLNTMTNTYLTTYWQNLNLTMWEYEARDQRGQIAHFAKIEKRNITGFRAPQLQTGGDVTTRVIYDEGMLYDSSRPTRHYIDPALWPYTADFNQGFQDCPIRPCFVDSYPGLWIVPIINMIGDDGEPCAFVDGCLPLPMTSSATYELLKRNFDRHYTRNKAPFGLNAHAAWFSPNYIDDGPIQRLAGYKMFLDYLGTLADVYIVSIKRALEWVMNPTVLSGLPNFAPWQHIELPSVCTAQYHCYYPPGDRPSERTMISCQVCPRKYPWIRNPYGLN